MIGVGTILLLIYLISLVRLWKLNNRRILHIETIAVFSCFVKVLLILIEEFVVNNEIFEFVILNLQASLIGFILYKLVKTSVEHTPLFAKNIRTEVWILRGFYIFMFSFLIVNLALGINNKRYFNWTNLTYSYNWYITLGLNTAMWYLNCVFGLILFRKRDHKLFEEDEFNVSDRDYKRVKLQMRVLTYGYAAVSTLLLLWFILFPFIFNNNEITWKKNNQHYWTPITEYAGVCAFIKSILLILPTVVIWLTFYWFRIPIHFNRNSIRLIDKDRSGVSSSSNVHNENKTVDALMLDISALSRNYKKSVFTNNAVTTKSFANNSQ